MASVPLDMVEAPFLSSTYYLLSLGVERVTQD
jgi:hypothetical protein